MKVAVLGHRGMLGRRVMERFPDAVTFEHRYTGAERDPLLEAVKAERPDWVIDCIGATEGDSLWDVNAVLPHRLLPLCGNLIYPSTDHVDDDTEYARSKKLGECGTVIRCAIVDPEGGLLARARKSDTYGEPHRQWNGVTAKTWARLARAIVDTDQGDGLIVPGSPTISHYDLLETARRVFGWPTKTYPMTVRFWTAETPTLVCPPIADQLAEYL
jgi:dTDP-4-dehydrorhamnose reductase